MRRLCIPMLFVLLVGCSAQSSETTTEGVQPPAAGSRKLALLIGINDYRFVSKLNGALNDVDDMFKVLTSTAYGFDIANIHFLKDGEATRARILSEIDHHLVDKAQPGDIVVLHYSGHGSLMKNPDDPTGWDNTIVPVDSRDPDKKVFDIRDKELNARLRRLTAKVGDNGGVTFILDSCHSGTGVRAVDVETVARAVPEDTRFGNNPPPLDLLGESSGTRDVVGSGYGELNGNYVLIAGSRSDQLSYELQDSEFQRHGALTYFLVQQLMQPSTGRRTYHDVMNQVIQAVNSEFPNQMPQLEGTNQDRILFGDQTLRTEGYVVANPLPGNQVEIKGGVLHGFTNRSEFDVYGADSHDFKPPEQPIARVQLVDVSALTSVANILSGKQVQAGSKAVRRTHAFDAQKTKILYESLANSSALRKIKDVIDSETAVAFESVGRGKPFQMRLKEDAGKVHIFGPDGVELAPPLSADSADTVSQMRNRLVNWGRWFGMHSLTNPAAVTPIELQLTRRDTNMVVPPGQITSFTPGANKFDLRVKNLSDRKLFIYLLDLTSVGESLPVYPQDNGSTVSVEPHAELSLPGWGVSLPQQNPEFVRDVFKLIATTNQIDVSFLRVEASRGVTGRGPDDPLNRLLFDAARGTRNGSLTVVDDWNTAVVVFDVCRQLNAESRCERGDP